MFLLRYPSKIYCPYSASDIKAITLSGGCSFYFWRMYKFSLSGLRSHPIFWIWPHCASCPPFTFFLVHLQVFFTNPYSLCGVFSTAHVFHSFFLPISLVIKCCGLCYEGHIHILPQLLFNLIIMLMSIVSHFKNGPLF